MPTAAVANSNKATSSRSTRGRFQKHRPSIESELQFELACELYEQVEIFLSGVGMSKGDQRRAALAQRNIVQEQSDRPSFRILRKRSEIGTILTTWKNDKRYLDKEGEPVVLPIAGSGRTLTGMVRDLNIDTSMNEIVSRLCEWGDVRRLKGNRVGLLGTSVVINNNPNALLGTIVTHIRRLVETTLLNAKLPRERRLEGLFQRAITGAISAKSFIPFAAALRPRLQEISDELEERIYGEDTSVIECEVDNVCGFEIFLFREGYEVPSAETNAAMD